MQLKILLQSKYFYILLFIFIVIYVFYKTSVISYESVLTGSETVITGEIVDYSLSDDKVSLTIKSQEGEVVIAYYYFEEDFDSSNLYGKEVLVTGEMYLPSNNTVPNTFNYKNYLYYNKIYYLFSVDEIEFISDNFNIKNILVNKISNYDSSDYLFMFILGDKSYLDDEMYSMYQTNGIAHLLAISGLHINLFVLLLEKMLKKVYKKNLFIVSFLLFYSYLTDFSVSVLRCSLFYFLKLCNEKYNFNLSNVKLLFLTAFILLLFNPFYIYNVGFQYSFVITYFLLILKPIKKKNYLISSLRLSFIALLASLPITVNMNYEINFSSIIFNLFFVPYVSFIVFPLSLLTFTFSFLDKVLLIFLNVLEFFNTLCYNYLSFIVNIPKLNVVIIIFYYISLLLLIRYKKKFFMMIIISLIINKLIYKLDSSYYVYYMDIGQGDCNVLISPYQSEVVMIDTGGSYYYQVSDNVILFLKSIGITSLDLLVISHGDSDHALDTENIYNNLEIKTILFNLNEVNDLELSIKELGILEVDSINLKYFKAQNINTNIDNENDASSVFYFYLYDYTFLFTGDIGTEPLTFLVDTYNLSCDFYKVAHHGSINNTSDYIISNISPKFAFISAGENNVYNHPSDEVLEILENNDVTVYQTLIDGSICVKVSEENYHIYTFPA